MICGMAVLAVPGCGREAPASKPAPVLTLLDSVVLHSSDSITLGNPETSLAVDDSGNIYVADQAPIRVLRYTADGSLSRVYGGQGQGPGELSGTMPATVVTDSLLIQPGTRMLHVFGRSSGAFRCRRAIAGRVNQAQVLGDSILVASFDFASRLSVMYLPAASAGGICGLSPDQPLEPTLAAQPALYRRYPGLNIHPFTFAAGWADSLLVGFGASNMLVLHTSDGVAHDTLWVPWRVRTGNPPDAYEGFVSRQSGLVAMAGLISGLDGVWRRADGSILASFVDHVARGTSDRDVKISGRAFLSVISPDRTQACLDAEIPFPGTSWPRVAMHGDTLLTLDLVPAGPDSLDMVPVVRRYTVDASECDWVPVRHSGSGTASSAPH